MMRGDGYGMSAAAALWWVALIVMLALIVIGIVLLVRGYAGRGSGDAAPAAGPPPLGSETPLQILEARYARGEIDREDFVRRKADLQA